MLIKELIEEFVKGFVYLCKELLSCTERKEGKCNMLVKELIEEFVKGFVYVCKELLSCTERKEGKK